MYIRRLGFVASPTPLPGAPLQCEGGGGAAVTLFLSTQALSAPPMPPPLLPDGKVPFVSPTRSCSVPACRGEIL